jgi:hypothetical protein
MTGAAKGGRRHAVQNALQTTGLEPEAMEGQEITKSFFKSSSHSSFDFDAFWGLCPQANQVMPGQQKQLLSGSCLAHKTFGAQDCRSNRVLESRGQNESHVTMTAIQGYLFCHLNLKNLKKHQNLILCFDTKFPATCLRLPRAPWPWRHGAFLRPSWSGGAAARATGGTGHGAMWRQDIWLQFCSKSRKSHRTYGVLAKLLKVAMAVISEFSKKTMFSSMCGSRVP